MLEEMDAHQFAEQIALDQIDAEDRKRAELSARAEAGVKSHRRKG